MKRSSKIVAGGAGTLLFLTVGLSIALPILENHSRYCFYCGHESTSLRLLGLPVWRSNGNLYPDPVKTPPHEHRMVEIGGFRFWLLRGSENWDEFGSTGIPVRAALVEGLTAHPERQAEILHEFLALDPQDHQANLHFVKAYRTKITEPDAP